MQTTETTDIQVENHGSVWLLRPLTDLGADWLQDHLIEEGFHHAADGAFLDPRMAAPIIRAMLDEGLEVR